MRQITRWTGDRYFLTQPALWSGQCPYNIRHQNQLNIPAWEGSMKFNRWFEIGQKKRTGGRVSPYKLFWRLNSQGKKYIS